MRSSTLEHNMRIIDYFQQPAGLFKNKFFAMINLVVSLSIEGHTNSLDFTFVEHNNG